MADNLVMISVDDLFAYDKFRETFGVTIQTPNLDRLAAHGVSMDAAYASTPLCGPSRASILTGQSPFETGIFGNTGDFYDTLDKAALLPTLLHDAGMATGLFGKVFHTYEMAAEYAAGMIDQTAAPEGLLREDFGWAFGGPAPAGVSDADFADYITIQHAIDFIAAHTGEGGGPFAVMAGLGRPHLPQVVPQEYFDLYPIEMIVAAGFPDNFYETLPPFALQFLGGPDPGASAAVAIQAYLASISFADAQLGRLLDALDAGNLWETTTVVLWSDHGYHLGDHDKWGKFTLWEEAANAPLIIAHPGQDQAGVHVDTPVSLTQLYATLADLLGLTAPDSVTAPSFAGLISSLFGAYDAAPVLTVAFGSLSMRWGDFRVIRYEDGSLEVYDLATDPGQLVNLALDPLLVDVVTMCLDQLRQTAAEQGAVFDAEGGLLSGTEGNDRLIAAEDVITAEGGIGDDTYFIRTGMQVIEAADAGFDLVVVRGTPGVAVVNYTLADNVEAYNSGIGMRVARITGNSLDNVFTDGKESDRLLARGMAGDDRFYAGTGNDVLQGGVGDDHILGHADHDILRGGAGHDLLDGGLGNDDIAGGTGNDRLTTGTGVDRILLRPRDGVDLVAQFSVVDRTTPIAADFDPLRDVLIFDRFAFADVDAVLAAFSDGVDGATLRAEGLTLTLWGISVADLTASCIELIPLPPPDGLM